MNPVRNIGRYQLPILNVFGIRRRAGWRTWFSEQISKWIERVNWRFGFEVNWHVNVYDVLLTNGRVIHFTEDEKQQLDQAREEHEIVMQIYGMARGLGLRT